MRVTERETTIAQGKQAKTEKYEELMALYDNMEPFLMALQTEFGVNRDIATEVWGEQLLDPSNTDFVEKLVSLLEAIKETPGKPLLIVRGFDEPTRRHGVSVNEKKIACALFSGISLNNILFFDGLTPYISITGNLDVLESKTGDLPGFTKKVVHPFPDATNSVVIGRKSDNPIDPSALFDLSHSRVRVYYNISADTAFNIGAGSTAKVPEEMILRIEELQEEEES